MCKYNRIDWIICFGYDWTSPSILSTRHIILKFMEDGKKVLWINPAPFRSISIKKIGASSFLKKIRNKLATHGKIIRLPQNKLIVFSPIYLPKVEHKHVRKINEVIIRAQISFMKKLLGIRKHFVWTTGSFTVNSILQKRDYEVLIYQAADLISDFRGISIELKKELINMERNLCERANFIFPASFRIKEKIENMLLNPKKVIYLPHGVDFGHFALNLSLADEVKNIPRPIAGYFGSLSDANDKDVLIELAKNGFSVVLIGKIMGDYSECFKYKNIFFLGPISYESLPNYAQYFDVCLLNWKMAEWIRNSFPKKTLEYLAMGKPVISIRIPEVEKQFNDLVYFANTPQEFVEQAKIAVEEDNSSLIERRKSRVKNETWDSRFQLVKRTLKKL